MFSELDSLAPFSVPLGLTPRVGLGEGFRDHTELVVELYPDGRVTVLTSTSELGQGAYTVCAQMAAERFAVPLERVQVAGGDSAIGLDAGTTTAQRTTLMLGNAILDAGRNAEQTLSGLAAEKLGWPAGPAALSGGSLQGTGGTVALDRLLAGAPLRVTGAYTLSTPSDNPEGLPAFKLKRPHQNHGYATHVAEVQVNTLTGEVRVLAMESHIDGGRPISVQGFEGQSEGAISRGIGYALFERLVCSHGKVLTTNFDTYVLASSLDLPPAIATVPVTTNDPVGPWGAKGITEVEPSGRSPRPFSTLSMRRWGCGSAVSPCSPKTCSPPWLKGQAHDCPCQCHHQWRRAILRCR